LDVCRLDFAVENDRLLLFVYICQSLPRESVEEFFVRFCISAEMIVVRTEVWIVIFLVFGFLSSFESFIEGS